MPEQLGEGKIEKYLKTILGELVKEDEKDKISVEKIQDPHNEKIITYEYDVAMGDKEIFIQKGIPTAIKVIIRHAASIAYPDPEYEVSTRLKPPALI